MSDCVSIVSEGDLDYDQIDFIEEGGQAKGMKGLFTVDPSSTVYLGRFTLNNNNKTLALKIAKLYQGKWGANNTKFIFAFELSDKDVPHVHFISYHNKPYAYSSMSDFWKKVDIKKEAGSWHKPAKTDEDIWKYLLYTIKDNDIIYTNLSDEELEYIKCKNDLIREDMSKSPLDKLLCRLKGRKFTQIRDLALAIIEIYVNEYNKPPPMAQLKGWTIYLWMKLGFDYYDINLVLDRMF